MEVNETITEVELKKEGLDPISREQQAQERWLAMLSDEGRQAQWLEGLQGLEGSFVCVKHV